MAFGFGFNKQKVLSSAEKFVQQGKLQNAITEYEKILKADPKDLTVTNTVGDLYARLGENDKAIDRFKSVGDAYATQGFTVKAIAMYKKLTKIRSSLESTLRLAELYTQQGLFNDARAQYLQVAEDFLRAGQLEQAVRIFQKTLEMDPDNVSMRTKLAEVYIRLGKKDEAWQIFSSAAETLRAKGALPQAEEILQRMLSLDPSNSYALLMRGRTAFDTGDISGTIENLEKVADLDSHPDGLQILLQAYLQAGQLTEAGALANKLATVHNDTPALLNYAAALVSAGQFEEALHVYDEYSDRLLASDSARVLESLHGLIGHVRDNTAALETLVDLFNRAGEQTHLTEVYELLAHAYVQAGDLEKSRDYYKKLTELEPQNQLHSQNYQQVTSKLGSDSESHLITAEEGAVMVDELEATAPFIEQRYRDEVALEVRASLTDAELYISYNMPEKALGPLLSVLPKAPRDLRLNQRLAALHTRASRFAEGAVCCRTLESLYHDAGYPDEATRYGELAAKYEERAAVTPGAKLPAELELPAKSQPAAPAQTKKSAPAPAAAFHGLDASAEAAVESAFGSQSEPEVAEFHVAAHPESEIDLSSEWEGTVTEEPVAQPAQEPVAPAKARPVAPAAKKAVPAAKLIAETVEEIKFYVSNGMIEEAFAGLAKLAELGADAATITQLQQEISSAQSSAAEPEVAEAQAPEEVAEIEIAEPVAAAEIVPEMVPEISTEEPVVAEAALAPPEPAPVAQAAPVAEPEPPAPVAEELPVAVPEMAVAPEAPVAASENLGSFVSDLESSLGEGFLPEQAASTAAKPEPAPAPEPEIQAEPEIQPEPESAPAPVVVAPAPKPQPPAPVAPPKPQAPVAQPKAPVVAPAPPVPAMQPAAAAPQAPAARRKDVLSDFVSDLEQSLGNDFAPEPPAPEVPTATTRPQPWPTQAPAAAPAVPAPPVAARSEVTPAPVPPVAQPAPAAMAAAATASPSMEISHPAQRASAPAAPSSAGVDLAHMFGELKQELEEGAPHAEEDPETHYNLGVAFREMGLLDEAISELQKVCQAVDHGHAFPHVIQTYTWLAQCFLDKGVPEAAIRWYEQALKIPNLDQESRVALHYELASSYETAHNKPAALNHFMMVYGSNIDYRDVSERIRALKS